jgi:hypothetical protein
LKYSDESRCTAAEIKEVFRERKLSGKGSYQFSVISYQYKNFTTGHFFILVPVGDDDRLLAELVGKQQILRHSRESGNPESPGKTGFPPSRE